MKNPILVVMAAGIGSRYGGLKQTDPIGPNGELIIDYSVYDAIEAGFKKVVFIINHKIKADFQEIIGNRLSQHIDVAYAYQELNDVPESLEIPKDRIKPLGTAHAVYCARHLIDAPFAVINADDYYGRDAFIKIYDYLSQPDLGNHDYTMVGYELHNTVTEHGYVSRGVCTLDERSQLTDVVERTHIEQRHGTIAFKDDADLWVALKQDAIVSMNMWGFSPSFVDELSSMLVPFLENALKTNPLKSEFYLPYVVDQLIKNKRCRVNVLTTSEKWYGVTYSEDKATLVDAIAGMCHRKKYPSNLWEVR